MTVLVSDIGEVDSLSSVRDHGSASSDRRPEPQSPASLPAPRAPQRAANVGVVMEATVPPGDIQFKLQPRPPSRTASERGKRLFLAATSSMCDVPEIEKEKEGEAAASEAAAVSATLVTTDRADSHAGSAALAQSAAVALTSASTPAEKSRGQSSLLTSADERLNDWPRRAPATTMKSPDMAVL